MVGWLVARWFLGGEMVGGEIPWWRDDRIPFYSSASTADSCSSWLAISFWLNSRLDFNPAKSFTRLSIREIKLDTIDSMNDLNIHS